MIQNKEKAPVPKPKIIIGADPTITRQVLSEKK